MHDQQLHEAKRGRTPIARIIYLSGSSLDETHENRRGVGQSKMEYRALIRRTDLEDALLDSHPIVPFATDRMSFQKISKIEDDSHRFEIEEYRMATPVSQDGIIIEC